MVVKPSKQEYRPWRPGLQAAVVALRHHSLFAGLLRKLSNLNRYERIRPHWIRSRIPEGVKNPNQATANRAPSDRSERKRSWNHGFLTSTRH
jgi:hypothetical protein